MADENPPITVRVDPEFRPVLRRYAKLLRRSEGQVLAMGLEDIATMVEQRGEEKLPQLVHLIRSAEEYEAGKPSLPLHKADKALLTGYRKGTYRVEPVKTGLVAEPITKKIKKTKI